MSYPSVLQCSFLHFLVVVVNIFCCAKSCWRADPPDAGAEDNGANMNIKTLPGSARGQQSNADWRTGKLLEPRIKWASRESSHRGGGGINWISITGAADASLMGLTVSQGNDDEDHLDRGRWDEEREQHDQAPIMLKLLGDEMCLSWRISNHCDFTPGPKPVEADRSCRKSLDTQSSHHSRIMRIRV